MHRFSDHKPSDAPQKGSIDEAASDRQSPFSPADVRVASCCASNKEASNTTQQQSKARMLGDAEPVAKPYLADIVSREHLRATPATNHLQCIGTDGGHSSIDASTLASGHKHVRALLEPQDGGPVV
jgi:hypothetical protein